MSEYEQPWIHTSPVSVVNMSGTHHAPSRIMKILKPTKWGIICLQCALIFLTVLFKDNLRSKHTTCLHMH